MTKTRYRENHEEDSGAQDAPFVRENYGFSAFLPKLLANVQVLVYNR